MEPIMTPAAAIYGFMAGFGIPAYAATSVPDEAEFPYITYELATDDFWGGEVALAMDIWYRGDSEAEPNAKAHEVSKALIGYKCIPCDDGGIILKKGSPFCQSMGDTVDDKIKRRHINLTAEFITSF
jgi:hypothetical protein